MTTARLITVICAVLMSENAHAGPPFRTDDPVPVELGHYEFYSFSTGTHVKGDTSGELPGFELTYGLIPNGQLQIGAATAFDAPSNGGTVFGYGDTEVSFKYRFIQEDKDGLRPQVALFPAVKIPTGNRDRGLGAGHVQVFLPVWVQKSFGDWTTDVGGGYWVNQNESLGDKDFWFVGWLLQRKITEQLTLGGEVFHRTADTVDGKDSTGFNLGGTYDFDDHNHLLFSAGRGFQNVSETNQVSWYFGWEVTY